MTRRDLGQNEGRPRLELVLEAAGLGEFEWDMHRGLLTVSERMAAITGLPAGQMPAQGPTALEPYVEPANMAALRADFERSRETGGCSVLRASHIRPDSVHREGRGRPDPTADGHDGISGIVEDVSSRRIGMSSAILMAEIDHREECSRRRSGPGRPDRQAHHLLGLPAELRRPAEGRGRANELLTAARLWRLPSTTGRAVLALARDSLLGRTGYLPDAARGQRQGDSLASWSQCGEVGACPSKTAALQCAGNEATRAAST